VSKEILNAFVTVNDGLETTKITFDGKLNNQYASFAASYNENKEKYGEAFKTSQTLRTQADGLVKHIDQIKAKTIAETEGIPMDQVIGKNEIGSDTILSLKRVSAKDNYDTNTNIMIGPEPGAPKTDDHKDGNNYRAAVLKDKLMEFGNNLKAMVGDGNPSLVASIDSLFSYPEEMEDASGTKTSWEALNFYHVPLAATTTILSKLQTDVRNAESDVLGFLFQDVEAASYKFTELRPIVLPQKTYVLENDSFKADVFLAAYDNTNLPTIKLAPDGTELDSNATEIPGEAIEVPIGADGLGKLRIPARSVGDKHWEGLIKFKSPSGKGFEYYKYNVDYEVARPSLVVSPTKMNVLYKGIDNPVSISVPGVSQDALSASISTGSLSKLPDGSYIAKVRRGTKATVSVTAEINGERQSMGSFDFRLKSVPDPVASFANKGPKDNTVKKSQLTAALGVIADLEDFVFDLKYPIRSFEITVISGGDVKTLQSSNNRVTPQMKELMQTLRRNQLVVIENIKATAPDGTIRKLGSISLRVI
jgi:gliding motility-associated protein GldM